MPTSSTAQAPRETPRLVIEAGGHQAIIRTLLFTADGRELVSVSDDKTIRIWHVTPEGRQATLARTIRGQIDDGREGMLATAALSPPDTTGRQPWLAVGGYLAGPPEDRYAIRLHDYASGDVITLLHGHRDAVLALAFSPDGRWLASAGKDHTVRLWDVAMLQGQHPIQPSLVLTGHTDHIYGLAWSATGDRLASASDDRTVSLWNMTQLAQGTVPLIARLSGHNQQVRTVAFHPGGTVLVSGSKDQTIRLWRASDGKAQGVFAQPGHTVAALTFAPNGQSLLAGNVGPPKPDHITLYAYPSGERQQMFTGHHDMVLATAFHPSGEWVASGGGEQKEILLWQVPTGRLLARLEGKGRTIWAVGFSMDGRAVSWGHTSHYRSENDRGPLEHRFDLSQLVRLSGGLQDAAAVRAQEHMQQLNLSTTKGGPYGYAYRLHIRRGEAVLGTIDRGEADGYFHGAYTFTPDGRHVLSGGENGVLNIYNLDGTLRARLRGHSGEIKAVAVSADGRWGVSGAVDQTLRLWALAALPASGSVDLLPALTLFPATDGEWVAWRPEGFFAASPQGAKLIGYSINQGVDKIAPFIAVEQLYERFYRPDLLHTKLYGDPTQLWQRASAFTTAETALAQGLPPQITFVSPSSTDATTAQREVDVRVTLIDQGGGIGKVVWKVEQVTTAIDPSTRNVVPRTAAPGRTMTLTQRLTLLPGQNTIELVAYTRDNAIASPPAKLTLTLAAGAAPVQDTIPPGMTLTHNVPPAGAGSRLGLPPGNLPSAMSPYPASRPRAALHVFVIGVNRYRDHSLLLKYAVPDAQTLVTTLRTVAAPLFRDVTVTTLVDEQVTVAGIAAAFARIAAQVDVHDTFVLYLAGHGRTQDGKYYFIPQDFAYRDDDSLHNDAVNQEHLQQWLASVPARKSLVLVDTCESGSFSQAFVMLRNMVEKTAADKLTRATGRATIVAAMDNQPALEGYQGHGVFTYVLLQALRQADASHGNHDGVTSIFEIATYVDDHVPAISRQVANFEQFPQVYMLGSDFSIGIVQPFGARSQ